MRGVIVTAVVATVFSFASPDGQQEEACTLEILTTPGQRTQSSTTPEGGTKYDVGGGVEATCGTKWLRADSASYLPDRGVLYLIGNMKYTDVGRELDAERATYYEREGWVHCQGNVRLSDAGGRSILSGPMLDFFPANALVPMDRIFAYQRPHLTFYADTTAGPDSQPFDVDADRMHIYGDSLIATAGDVVAIRGELTARSDSMNLDMGQEELWLLGEAPFVTASDMVLEGDTILVKMEQRKVREIHAWPNGSTIASDLRLMAPAIRLFVDDEDVSRAVASAGDPERTGAVDSAGRAPWAFALASSYTLTADSIDIQRPGGELERVIAIDRARATTQTPVGPGPELLGNDWLEGDTITAYFTAEPSAEPDKPKAELDRLVAVSIVTGKARALYHLVQQGDADGASGTPAPNYVIGRIITLWLEEGRVKEAEVIGPALGIYLEPIPTRPDTTLALPDSLATEVNDTSAVPEPGTRR